MSQASVASNYSLRVSRQTKFNIDQQPEKIKKIRKIRGRKPNRVPPSALQSCSSTELSDSYDVQACRKSINFQEAPSNQPVQQGSCQQIFGLTLLPSTPNQSYQEEDFREPYIELTLFDRLLNSQNIFTF